MDMAHVKWYAEKLHELLQQDLNNPRTVPLLSAVDGFLKTTGIDRLEAKIPAGLYEDAK